MKFPVMICFYFFVYFFSFLILLFVVCLNSKLFSVLGSRFGSGSVRVRDAARCSRCCPWRPTASAEAAVLEGRGDRAVMKDRLSELSAVSKSRLYLEFGCCCFRLPVYSRRFVFVVSWTQDPSRTEDDVSVTVDRDGFMEGFFRRVCTLLPACTLQPACTLYLRVLHSLTV